jgi:hypothetical protein
MRTLRISLLVALASCAALWAAFAPVAVARVSTYKGQFQCDDRGTVTPLAGMNVELWERGSPDFLPVEWVGHRVDQDFTGADGSFAMTTEDNNDNYFVRMALRDAHGVHLRDFWGINDWSVDTGQQRNDVPVRDYGGLLFSTPGQSHKCAIWAGVHGAYERYRAEVGADLPTHGVELQADAVTAGVPFTPGTSILWPGGFPVGYSGGGDDSITRHEFGHVIRHGFDGDFGHFLGDVATYNYLQNHEPCLHSNGGYAFNEGWAEFWAADFWPAPDCGRPGDMETEGNVAAALQALMENCAGGKRKLMVETLQRNPGTIHSFDQFKAALGCPEPKLFPVTVIVAELAPPKPPEPISPAARAAIAGAEVRATGKRIKGLTKTLDAALDKADRAPATCTGKGCAAVLKTVTRPAVLEFERDVARIHLRTVDDFDSAREQTKLAGTDLKKLLDAQHARELRDQRKTVKAALGGVEDAIGAVRPYLKDPSSSGSARGILIGLNKAAGKFRKARKKGSKGLPSLLTVSPFAVKAPRRVKVIPPPPPAKLPTASVRTITTMTLNCPALVASPKPFEVSGTLAPGQAGSAVKVSFQFGAGAPVFVTATTDAAGNWSASYTPSPNDTGTWTVSASYGGDSSRTGSTSPPRSIDYA